MRNLLITLVVLVLLATSVRADDLLAELSWRDESIGEELSSPTLGLNFNTGIGYYSGSSAGFQTFWGPADVGAIINIPDIAQWHTAMTATSPLALIGAGYGGNHMGGANLSDFWTGYVNGTVDFWSMQAFVPQVGPNFYGYTITDITWQLDVMTMTPVVGSLGQIYYNTDAGTTLKIYGHRGVPGDYNADDVVDAADYVAARNLGITDLSVWQANYGQPFPVGAADSAITSTPEPSSVVLLLLGLCVLVARR